jgi:phosphatidylglycerol:prolipoprotein diacylglycerol transferase
MTLPDPVAFHIFSWPIRWYGIMAALGCIAAYITFLKNRKYAKLDIEQVSDILFLLIISGIVGARIFYCVEYYDQFKYSYTPDGKQILNSGWQIFLQMLQVYNGGIVFYGGFIFAVIALFIYCRKKQLNFWRVSDMAAPGLALGHAFGRAGCFLNGCCYGKVTDSSICAVYPAGTFPAERYPVITGEGIHQHLHSMHLYPVQMYESFCNIFIAAVLMYLLRKLKTGQTLALYFIMYGIVRFSDEFLRGDYNQKDLFFNYLKPGQFVSIFLIPAGIIMFIYFAKNKSLKNTVISDEENIEK